MTDTIEKTEGRAPAATPRVEVKELAVHTLDYRGNGLVLADGLVQLTAPVRELFQAYLLKGLQSDLGRLARFTGSRTVSGTASRILDGTLDFLEGSRELASRLFSAMQGKKVASGDVAMVRAVDTEADQELLAILKLDLQRGLKREIVRSDGQTLVKLLPVTDLLPEAERRIQKCAFIPARPHSYPYDLVVIDNQATGPETSAANYFAGLFLGCELLEGPKELTRKLPQETERWLQEEGAAPQLAIQAREAVIHALQDPEVNLERVADEACSEPGQRERFLDHMQTAGFSGGSFSTDRGAADRLSSTLTYVLDNGVRISGDAEAVAELLQVEDDPTEDGKVRIVIESFRFERRY